MKLLPLVVAGWLAMFSPCLADVSRDRLITLARGVNLISVFTMRPLPLIEHDLDEIAAAGLRHVRIFVDPDWVLQQHDYPQARLDSVVSAALTRRLGVILCMFSSAHPLAGALPQSTVEIWLEAWRRLASQYAKSSPGKIFFEIDNEPDLPPDRWNALQHTLLQAVRQVAPQNTVLLTGTPTSTVWSLSALTPVADENVIYAFHLYQPMAFTHQGADWDDTFRPLHGIVYPPQPGRPSGLDLPASSAAAPELARYAQHGAVVLGDEVAAAKQWATSLQRHVTVTEFGVYRTADPKSRAAWLSEARTRLEKADIGWTVWEYDGGFGIKPDLSRCTQVVASLGLHCPGHRPNG